jgi:hypothetical protein
MNDMRLRPSRSQRPRSFISLIVSLGTIAPALPTEPGLLPSPSILLIPNASLSYIGLEPNKEEGSGWELYIEMDSEHGGTLIPPSTFFDGGTPMRLVGRDAEF